MGTHNSQTHIRRIPSWLKQHKAVSVSGLAAVLAIAGVLSIVGAHSAFSSSTTSNNAASSMNSTDSDRASFVSYKPLSIALIAALPEASYSAVIPGLIPVPAVTSGTSGTLGVPTETAAITATAPLYGAGMKAPVARMQAEDFTGNPTVIDVIKTSGDWALILTPARQALPSASADHTAAAQTEAWIPAKFLTRVTPITSQITASVADQQLTITQAGKAVQSFQVGVGTRSTPSPTGVTGYLQARYVDPANGTGNTMIQLSSLHSAVQDNPVGGTSGGLIALHWYPHNQGAVSHGCIRLTAAALAAVEALPLGTPITITN